MNKNCVQCKAQFEITQEDLAFYDKISPTFNEKKFPLPAPTLCPNCRCQRRMTFRNFWNLYHRKCDLTGKQIISMYAPESPYKVYDLDLWASDRWDPFTYGQDFDFNRPFFDQMHELFLKVPRQSLCKVSAENCDYSNMVFGSKNCYLIFGCVQNENCCYGHIVWESVNCYDCLYVWKCEWCYECLDCVSCYNLTFSKDCEGCSDSAFLLDCRGCRDCFGCVGLRNKQYYIYNQPYTPEEYAKKMQTLDLCDPSVTQEAQKNIDRLALAHPFKYMHSSNAENCTGDYIYNSRNVSHSFDIKKSEDLKYCYTIKEFKDSYDANFSGITSELVYDSMFVYGYNIKFSHLCFGTNTNLLYCDSCVSCRDCFGCVGLKQKQYCIFNKQYSKEQYEVLVARIIEHIQRSGEWGEFFPSALSPFAYNETMAQEYFPLRSEEAISRGYHWRQDDPPQTNYQGSSVVVPPSINDVPDDFTKQILQCAVTGKLYKIIPEELAFYRKMQVPIPLRSPAQRQKDRMAKRNPRFLWSRACMQCGVGLQTSYAPDRLEKIYCENCYLKAVY